MWAQSLKNRKVKLADEKQTCTQTKNNWERDPDQPKKEQSIILHMDEQLVFGI